MTSTITPTSAPSGIDATYYLVREMPRAVRFYREVVGLPLTSGDENSQWVEFELPDGNTFGLGVLEEWQHGGGVMFAVDDLEAAFDRVRASGATVHYDGIVDTPACEMVWFEDPDGNTMAFHRRKVQ